MITKNQLFYVFTLDPEYGIECRRQLDYDLTNPPKVEEFEVYQMDFSKMPPQIASVFSQYSCMSNNPNINDMLMMARQYLTLVDHGPKVEIDNLQGFWIYHQKCYKARDTAFPFFNWSMNPKIGKFASIIWTLPNTDQWYHIRVDGDDLYIDGVKQHVPKKD